MNELIKIEKPRPRIVSSEKLWLESEALEQLQRVSELSGCTSAVGMPDIHPGPGGTPIGVVAAFDNVIRPHLLGSDLGCGARVTVTTMSEPSLDRTEKAIREEFSKPFTELFDNRECLAALAQCGISSLANCNEVPAGLARIAEIEAPSTQIELPTEGIDEWLNPIHLQALGSTGGGNHFVELGKVSLIRNKEIAATLGIKRGALVVIVHSGARSLGMSVSRHMGMRVLEDAQSQDEFLRLQQWACRYAQTNRFLLSYRVLRALGLSKANKLSYCFDCTHNAVAPLPGEGFLHRKGVVSALKDEPLIVLASRGAPSLLALGKGSKQCLYSAAHGAGRRMNRADALSKLKSKYDRKSLSRTALGSRVICDRNELLYEEHPDAYKPIGPVIRALVEAGTIEPVAELEPILTVKQ